MTPEETPSQPQAYSFEEAVRLTRVTPDLLEYYCQAGLLGAPTRATFNDQALYEVARLEHYRKRHRVAREALPLILELLREVERMEAELRFLRDA